MTEKTIEELITEAQQLAQSEFGGIQIVGRALTEDEIKRSEALSNCLEHLGQALAVLQQKY